ncbi:mycofactocin precursor MftA [Actinocorallia sp. A-T 12471]|nr:mycofactocin precursor MftA [Actinocorallia sp. A-T 12471]MDX6742674.1 mycofactocin precursor MftA [Actinocorallia sp. A-T 12471]
MRRRIPGYAGYPKEAGGAMNENQDVELVESLIEEVSIDGMCGVY